MPATDPPSPTERRPQSVVVSYAHEDRTRAQAIVAALEQAGFEVWWDTLIVGGSVYASKTEQALESAAVVVVLWSRDSLGSHWVRDEAARGRDRGCLVPVSLDGCEPPLGFRQYQVIDLSKWHGKADAPEIDAVLLAVRVAQGQAPPAAPLAAPRAGTTTRRRLLIGYGSLAAVALAGGSWLAWRRGLVGLTGVASNGVAVLPFKNLSGDPGQAYFSDGLAAELIDGRSGFSRWTQTFDRPIDNIFAVQSEIAGSVVAALGSEMGRSNGEAATAPPAELPPGGTTNVAAFDAYLRGRALYNMSEGETQDREALAAFEAAISADPKFAAAHAARARSLLVLANHYADAAHTAALYDAAIKAAETAIALAPELADAQSTLGYVRLQGRLDVKGARQPYELSRELGEGDATVMGRFALYCAITGRAAEARPAMERALKLDPLNPLVHRAMAHVLYAAHRYAEVVPHVNRALTLNPKLPGAHAAIGDALLLLGRTLEARDAYLAESDRMVRLPGIAIAERKLGNEAAARDAMSTLVSELGDSALYQQAEVRAQWGERETALAVLAHARALSDSGLVYARNDPLLDPLRPLPEFGELLRQLGFD